MAKIGIIAALDCEIELFIRDFSAVLTENPYIYHGTFAGHDVYLTLCGIGKVNAALCTQRLIDLVKPDMLINSGVAGGVSDTLGICDLAISDKLTYHDFYPIDVLEQYAPGCSVFCADEKLVRLASDAAARLNASGEAFRYETGMIVSGDMFVEDAAYNRSLAEKYNALCTEMEGAAVAHVAVANGTPFVVIRAISDHADADADMSFEQMKVIAAARASALVRDMIEHC